MQPLLAFVSKRPSWAEKAPVFSTAPRRGCLLAPQCKSMASPPTSPPIRRCAPAFVSHPHCNTTHPHTLVLMAGGPGLLEH